MPLGGLGEVGMNCLCFEYEGSRIVVDTGLTFPDDKPGAEIAHPNFGYLQSQPMEHEAVVLTHGHEDHVGALPFLLRDRPLPVHGTPYALAVAGNRLAEHGPELKPEMTPTEPGKAFRVGALEIEPFRVAHSIPDCTGLIIRSPVGTVVHTADFRIDRDPPDGAVLDETAMAAIGDAGVRVLLSDSTNIERPRVDGGEKRVAQALAGHVMRAPGRLVVTMFSSNLYRLQGLVDAARASGRKLVLLGRSLQSHASIGEELGHLKGLDSVRIDPSDAAELPPAQVLVAATGSQGEVRAALRRLAAGTHPALRLDPGDEVIHSARIIPGKERTVYELFDHFARAGIRLRHRLDDANIHVSGHASREDLQRMLELTRPQTFVPIHGSRHHLQRHGELATSMGFDDVHIIENGTRLMVGERDVEVETDVEVGRVFRQAGLRVDDVALKDREVLSEVGMCLLSLTLDQRGRLAAPARVFTRGLFREDAEPDLLDDLEEAAEDALAKLKPSASDGEIMDATSRPLRRLLKRALRFRPPVYCLVTRIDP